MLSIKRKLSSKAGASMLLAMVFLMFCLFIGGSVLAAATANGSRVEHLKNDQQDYLSQRSAMLLMADMLTGDSGEELQLVISDVTVKNDTSEVHTVTFTSPSVVEKDASNDLKATFLQKVLFEVVINNYPVSSGTKLYSQFNWISDSAYNYSPTSGDIQITAGSAEPLTANFTISTTGDYDLKITFGDNSYMTLSMDGSIGEGKEKIVTIGDITTTTKTTVIRWSKPVIEKRAA